MKLACRKTLLEQLLEMGVKQRQDKKVCGLLVSNTHARRFVEGPYYERKTMEIRSKAVKFLEEGECIMLISTNAPNSRRVLGVLRFEQCIKIAEENFSKFYDLHRVTPSEFEKVRKAWKKQDHVFGYQFELVHIFNDPPMVSTHLGETWIWLQESQLVEEHKQLSAPIKDIQPTASLKRLGSELDQEDRMAKQPRSERPEPASPGKCAMDAFRSDRAVHMTEQAAASSDEDEGGDVTCILLLATEWEMIASKQANTLLRPFSTAARGMIVVVRRDDGHRVVGEFQIHEATQNNQVVNKSSVMYSSDQLQGMKKNKTIWVWRVSGINVLDEEVRLKFLDIAPRFKNRPFKVRKEELRQSDQTAAAAHIPKDLSYSETAKFFIAQMGDIFAMQLADRIRHLKGRNACIRVGTTCSGSDVCVSVLRQTVQFLNQWQDCLPESNSFVCVNSCSSINIYI